MGPQKYKDSSGVELLNQHMRFFLFSAYFEAFWRVNLNLLNNSSFDLSYYETHIKIEVVLAET